MPTLDTSSPNRLPLASIGERFTAQFIDGLVGMFFGAILFVVLGIVDIAFILGKSRRRLGDYLVGTKVVRLP